jgi:hypothetical protein
VTDLRLVDANLVAMWAECNAGLGGDSILGKLRVLRAKKCCDRAVLGSATKMKEHQSR